MSVKNEPPVRGIESRFRDLSVDVRQERVVRYIVHQAQSGRHVKDIVNDPYVVAHLDQLARDHIIEHPGVIKGIEEQIRRQFAGYGHSVEEAEQGGGDESEAGRTSDAELPRL